MLFAIFCIDKPNSSALRQSTRPAHLDYLKGFADKIALGGPLLTDDGQASLGSLIVIDQPDKKAAEAFSAGDPFRKAGLFAEVEIRAFRKSSH
jgi:uncharacterized protein